jgi:hypothetical protein
MGAFLEAIASRILPVSWPTMGFATGVRWPFIHMEEGFLMAMNTREIVLALTPLVDVLERLNVSYHIGGSVASSICGEARPTQDVDVVADLRLNQVRTFVKLLEADYYVDEDAVRDAIRRHSSFNVIPTPHC